MNKHCSARVRSNIIFTMNKTLFDSCWYLDEAPTHGEVTCTDPYKVCRWADVGNSHQSDPKPSNLEIKSQTKIPKCYPCTYSRRPPKRSEVVVCRSLHCVGQVGRGLPDVDGVKAGRRVNNVTLTATTIMKARAKPPPWSFTPLRMANHRMTALYHDTPRQTEV